MNFNPFENFKLKKVAVGEEFTRSSLMEGSKAPGDEEVIERVIITAINSKTGMLTYKKMEGSNNRHDNDNDNGTNVSRADFLELYR